MLYAVTKLNSVDVRSLCSCVVCGRMSLLSVVCVCLEFLSWWNPVIESMTRFHQERNSRHTHTTDDNDIRPHTVQERNERTSAEFNGIKHCS